MSKRAVTSKSQQTVLILGGTGEIGKLVIQQLLEKDIKVRAVVRFSLK
jgi:uncharacterized protein YbjT (DUF2867 family)